MGIDEGGRRAQRHRSFPPKPVTETREVNTCSTVVHCALYTYTRGSRVSVIPVGTAGPLVIPAFGGYNRHSCARAAPRSRRRRSSTAHSQPAVAHILSRHRIAPASCLVGQTFAFIMVADCDALDVAAKAAQLHFGGSFTPGAFGCSSARLFR